MVDFPTPPLPDAIATMFLTFDSRFRPCWTECATIFWETSTVTLDAPVSRTTASDASPFSVSCHVAHG